MLGVSFIELICYAVLIFLFLCLVGIIFDQYRYKKLSNSNLKNKHVVITGGSSGIGKSLAVEAVLRGANVTIIARDESKLKSAKREILKNCIYCSQKVFIVSLDVSGNDYEEIEKTFNFVEQQGGPVFLLINCAGAAFCRKLEDISPCDIRKLHDLNCIGSIVATRAVIEGMKSRGEGHIVLISSAAGLLGIYGYTAYSSSKFALRGFAEALQMETLNYGIKITVAYPPDTDTPGFAVENQGKPKETKLICQTAGLFEPEYIARQIIKDTLAGRFASYVGVDGFMLAILTAGFSPCSSVLQILTEVLFMGAFRIVALLYLYSFKRIIQKCMAAKDLSKKAQ